MKTWLCTSCEKTFSNSYYCPHCGAMEGFELLLDTTEQTQIDAARDGKAKT